MTYFYPLVPYCTVEEKRGNYTMFVQLILDSNSSIFKYSLCADTLTCTLAHDTTGSYSYKLSSNYLLLILYCTEEKRVISKIFI